MELPFGLPVILYFGLAAITSGAAILGSLLTLSCRSRYSTLRSRSFLLAAIAIGLGGMALVLDLESPSGWWKILAYFNPQSWISVGARIVVLFGLVTTAAWLFFRARMAATPSAMGIILALLVLVAGVAVALYPAFVLRQMTARALWASASWRRYSPFRLCTPGRRVWLSSAAGDPVDNTRLTVWDGESLM